MDSLLSLFPPGSAKDHDGMLLVGGCRADDLAAVRGGRQMSQEGGLADARLTAEDQHPALPRTYSRDELLQRLNRRAAV